MQLAGLEVGIALNTSELEAGAARASTIFSEIAKMGKNAFSGIPDFGKNFKFNTNGASQAAQDAREYARAAREAAEAEKARIQAQIAQQKEQDRQNSKSKQLTDAYAKLVAESNALVRAYYNEAAAQLKAGDATESAVQKLEDMRQAALESQQALAKIEQGAGRFQRNVGNYASAFNPLQNTVTQLTREFPAFANSVQTGLLGISNNIGPLADAIRQIIAQNQILISQGKPTQSVFSQLAGAVFSWQTALSLGITALTIFGPKIYDLIKGANGASAATKKLKEEQEALNRADEQAIESASEQIAELRTLNSIITNTALSVEQRTAAYKESVSKYDEYLGKVSRDAALNGGLAKIINEELIPAILAAAKARAYQEKINILTKKQIQQEEDLTRVKGEQAIAQSNLNSANAQAGRLANTSRRGDDEAATYAVVSNLSDAQVKVNQLNEEFQTTNDGLAQTGRELDNLSAKLQEYTKQSGKINPFGEGGGDKGGNSVKAATDLLGDLQKANREANAEFEAGLITFGERTKQVSDNYRKYASEIISNGFGTATSKDVQEAIAQANKLQNELSFDKLETGTAGVRVEISQPGNIALATKDFEELGLVVSKLGPIVQKSFSDFRKGYEQAKIDASARKAQERWTAAIAEFKQNLMSAIQDVGVGLMEGFGAILGDIFAGNEDPFGKFLKGFGALLGDQIVALGKQLIVAGGLMEAAQNAIKALGISPAAAIGIGGALIIGGAALKAALSKQAEGVGRTAFAQGGVVYGPTNALIGEYSGARSNPEVVAPLDKLKSMLGEVGGGTQVFIPEVRLQGQDIYIAFKRSEQAHNR